MAQVFLCYTKVTNREAKKRLAKGYRRFFGRNNGGYTTLWDVNPFVRWGGSTTASVMKLRLFLFSKMRCWAATFLWLWPRTLCRSCSLLFPPGGRFRKPVLKFLQIHPLASEAHAFGFQQKSLLHRRLAPQRDTSAGAQDPLPRKPAHFAQGPSNMARVARITGSLRNRTVGTHPPAWNFSDRGRDGRDQRRSLLAARGHAALTISFVAA